MERGTFTYFLPPIYNTHPERNLTLREVWEYISGRETLDVSRRNTKTGELSHLGDLLSVTKKVRGMSPEDYSDRQKGKVQYLPLVTFGGVFSQREGDGLQETSGLVGLDIDHISQLEGVSLEDLKERLSQDREIGLRLLFTSPSGDGLKIVCKTSGQIKDRESYRREFESLNSFVSRKYSIPIGEVGLDKGISDISRGCFLCYDPGAILRDWGDTFRPEDHPLPTPKKDYTDLLREFAGYDMGDGVEEIVRRVEDSGRDIAPDYSTYLPLVYSFTSLGERGRSLLHRVCRLSPKYVQENTDRDWEECNKSPETQSIGYFINLCKSSGIDVSLHTQRPRRESYRDRRTTLSPETGSTYQRTTPEETPEEKFKDYLQIPDLRTIASTKREGIKTGYYFKDSQGREENFILTSGGLTMIGGQSSHGKSRLLQNLSLRIATEEYNNGGDGVVLYFAFEETLLEVLTRYANIQANIPHLSEYQTKNEEVLRDYFKTGTLNKCPQKTRTEALPRLSSFAENLYKSGRLRVYYTPDLYSEDLCSLLEYLSSQMKIKAVFLDYVQAIYKKNYRKERREELREVCKELNKTAKGLDVPIVLSVQLNRVTKSPTEMSGSNIADSQDITRYADSVLLLWDSVRDRDLADKETYLQSKDYSRLQALGFEFGVPGKLYTILEKNRGGTPYLESVLDYVPETGYIPDNLGDLPPDNEGVLVYD